MIASWQEYQTSLFMQELLVSGLDKREREHEEMEN
jgi:hypothetical protein